MAAVGWFVDKIAGTVWKREKAVTSSKNTGRFLGVVDVFTLSKGLFSSTFALSFSCKDSNQSKAVPIRLSRANSTQTAIMTIAPALYGSFPLLSHLITLGSVWSDKFGPSIRRSLRSLLKSVNVPLISSFVQRRFLLLYYL